MFTKHLFFLSICLLMSTPLPATAKSGKFNKFYDGGGGEVIRYDGPTSDQARQAVRAVQTSLGSTLESLLVSLKESGQVSKDPMLSEFLTRVSEGNRAGIGTVVMLPLNPDGTDGDCINAHGVRMAMIVRDPTPGSPICIDIKELKKVPLPELHRQVTGLVSNALAIQHDLDTESASRIQNFVLENLKQ